MIDETTTTKIEKEKKKKTTRTWTENKAATKRDEKKINQKQRNWKQGHG